MPKPRRLSGAEVIRILEDFGFQVEHQRGSHTKLVRVLDGRRQVLTVPNHKELKTGAVVALFRQSSKFIAESELHPHFYTP